MFDKPERDFVIPVVMLFIVPIFMIIKTIKTWTDWFLNCC